MRQFTSEDPYPWGDFGQDPFTSFGFFHRPFSDIRRGDFFDPQGIFGWRAPPGRGARRKRNGAVTGATNSHLDSLLRRRGGGRRDGVPPSQDPCHDRANSDVTTPQKKGDVMDVGEEFKHDPLFESPQEEEWDESSTDDDGEEKEFAENTNLSSTSATLKSATGAQNNKKGGATSDDDYVHFGDNGEQLAVSSDDEDDDDDDEWETLDEHRPQRRWSWESVSTKGASSPVPLHEDSDNNDEYTDSVERGLKNQKNYICYCNCVLVWLANEPCFQSLITGEKSTKTCRKLLSKIFKYLHKNGEQNDKFLTIDGEDPVECLIKEIGFPVGSQECASDFLGRLLNRIVYEESLNGKRDVKANLFEWQFVSTLYSQEDAEGSSNLEVLTQIPLCDYYPKLEDAISKFSNASEFVEYRKEKAIKCRAPISAPPCAIFTLRFRTQHRVRPRFSDEEINFRRLQIEEAHARNDDGLVAALLDSFANQPQTQFVVEKNAKRMSFPKDLNPLNPARKSTHFLSAVVAHLGLSGQGHYITYIRDSSTDVRWRKIDNDKITFVSFNMMIRATYGDDSNDDQSQQIATVLVYRAYE